MKYQRPSPLFLGDGKAITVTTRETLAVPQTFCLVYTFPSGGALGEGYCAADLSVRLSVLAKASPSTLSYCPSSTQPLLLACEVCLRVSHGVAPSPRPARITATPATATLGCLVG